jgi:hypothetical protein
MPPACRTASMGKKACGRAGRDAGCIDALSFCKAKTQGGETAWMQFHRRARD